MFTRSVVDRLLTIMTFVISFVVYFLTLEDTVSFWDCGEFITSAAGLQIGHPPGAPLYAMAARVFAAMAPSSAQVAFFINIFSAIVSALTITFLYKSILLLFQVSFGGATERWFSRLLAAFAAAMTFAFTDTFWFSAVEAEVYAFSSLFTAACFWAGLKWYTSNAEGLQSRWLLLIAYLCGLSYGVHLLNLLIIPAIGYLVVSKRYNLSFFKKILAIIGSSLAVGVVMYGYIPLLLWYTTKMELIFVNVFGLPYNSGALTAIALLFMSLGLAIWFCFRRGYWRVMMVALSIALFTVGFGSYTMIIIRGTQNPPMNQSQVDNIFSLKSYLDRDQYGKTPLIYGPYYSAPVETIDISSPIYIKDKGGYRANSYNTTTKYYKSHCTLFPRMYSTDPDHIESYQSWTGMHTDSAAYKTENGNVYKAIKPSFTQNMTFFAGYQLWWMYFRYLLWNYSGRQNDLIGNGNILNGNFITGFKAIDNMMLGPQDQLPDAYKGKSHNRYFLIPLLLGFLGLYYQWKSHENTFLATLILFFFTGIAIVIFLNQTPYQPRERDYAYVGSFYVFAIWIGFGMLYITKLFQKFRSNKLQIAASLVLLAVPTLVIAQNYDDHDRSGRAIARNYAYNYLSSLPSNSLLITYGDNDTFPLWYLQMVEGVRQDVKVFNQNYLYSIWNPGQLERKTYTCDGFKLLGSNVYDHPDEMRFVLATDSSLAAIPLHLAMRQMLTSDTNNRIQSPFKKGVKVRYLPQNMVVLPTLDRKDSSNIFLSPNQKIFKDQVVLLDVINGCYPERTVNFAQTVPPRTYSLIKRNLSRVGLNFHLIIHPADSTAQVCYSAALQSYNFLMTKFSFDRFDKDILLDEVSKEIINAYRKSFMSTASALASSGDTAKAVALMRKCIANIPPRIIPLKYKETDMVTLMLKLNMHKEALELVGYLTQENLKMLNFMESLNSFQKKYVFAEKALALQSLSSMATALSEHGELRAAQQIEKQLEKYDKL